MKKDKTSWVYLFAIFLLSGFSVWILVGTPVIHSECIDGTYHTKAICFYQPDNKLCPVYCEDYKMHCLKGKYILQKDDGEYTCLSVNEYLKGGDNEK